MTRVQVYSLRTGRCTPDGQDTERPTVGLTERRTSPMPFVTQWPRPLTAPRLAEASFIRKDTVYSRVQVYGVGCTPRVHPCTGAPIFVRTADCTPYVHPVQVCTPPLKGGVQTQIQENRSGVYTSVHHEGMMD